MHAAPARPGSSVSVDAVREALDHAAHLLPGQRPIESFVHHNTLHAFEGQPFFAAVEEAAVRFGAEPYMSEAAFRAAWASGRILDRDLDAALRGRVSNEERFPCGPERLGRAEAVRRLMLWLGEPDGGATLVWRLRQGHALRHYSRNLPRDAFERLRAAGPAAKVLPRLWKACARVAAAHRDAPPPPAPAKRPRDWVLHVTGEDTDERVHATLIRWCAAYLDGGYAYWPMTDRGEGFFRAALRHLSAAPSYCPWLRGARRRADALLESGAEPLPFVAEVIASLGWREGGLEELIDASLLALPGWAGMFVQLRARPDLAPHGSPKTDLADFLAVRLLLDDAAARHALGRPSGALSVTSCDVPTPARTVDPAWQLFSAAQLLGVRPCDLDSPDSPSALALVELFTTFHEVRRRSLWQLAYERRYRCEIMDALLAHRRTLPEPAAPPRRPKAQVVCCIDDREESLRRHLEEIDSAYETFGFAGFYGVAMYYQALGDPVRQALCPANHVPVTLVREAATSKRSVSRLARYRARATEMASVGSETLFRGGLIALGGWSSLIPLVTRTLFPRLHARFTTQHHEVEGSLELEAPDASAPEATANAALRLGFTRDEMIDIVRRTLEDMGLTRSFAPLVVLLGHGSRSLNNPHEAAHDCGACGGGRGGPNARAFATMANRGDVRAALRETGIAIPDDTWFVGGYHNTCDDDVILYDLTSVPPSHLARVQEIRHDLDRARRLDAHERCRRFESAPLSLTPDEALEHVQGRAEDLAQPRPEYGHATNALCLVGRRAWSRGLFLDRRVFLTSYDPAIDPDHHILGRLLASVGPVGAGISLEYYFSFVDNQRYGSGTKLPHNVTALLGVMDGHQSDLRTGLPWQMVEIHEPMRLLNVIEARPDALLALLERQPGLRSLIERRWILVVAYDPAAGEAWFFGPNGFEPYVPESDELPSALRSQDWYGGRRGHLPPCTIAARLVEGEAA